MKELLSKWSELEPERCSSVGDRFLVDDGFCLHNFGVCVNGSTGQDRVFIQCAVQRAMVVHGMTGGARYEKLPNGFYSWIARVEWDSVGCGFSDDFPSYALLYCYLDRLEAKIKNEVTG